MGTIAVTDITDGTTADAADVNDNINTIVNEFNGNIENANIASSANIDASKLADATITNSKLDTTQGELGGALASWTPTLTNVDAGKVTIAGNYYQIGKLVFAQLKVLHTNTSAHTGTVTMAIGQLPVAPNTAYYEPSNPGTSGAHTQIGVWAGLDDGTQMSGGQVIYNEQTPAIQFRANDQAGSDSIPTISATHPITWTTNDMWSIQIMYEAA